MITTIKYKKPDSSFYLDMKKEVEEYLKEYNMTHVGGKELLQKYYILVLLFFSTLGLTYFIPSSYPIARYVLYGFLGLVSAGIGFNVLHDVSHGTFSENEKINKTAKLFLLVLGVSLALWIIKHVKIHHFKTNTVDDDDLFSGWILRMHPSQPLLWIHRYQFIYAPFLLYQVLYFFWVFWNDFVKYWTKRVRNYDIRPNEINRADHFNFWLSKIVHISLFIVFPWLLFGWKIMLIGYAVYSIICSAVISNVFQLAHVVNETEFFTNDEDGFIDVSLIDSQILSTANFYFKNIFLNKVLNWYTGGLNFQIEHHLFPKICSLHYEKIAPIVKKHVLAHGLPYNTNPVHKAIKSHLKELYVMGRK